MHQRLGWTIAATIGCVLGLTGCQAGGNQPLQVHIQPSPAVAPRLAEAPARMVAADDLWLMPGLMVSALSDRGLALGAGDPLGLVMLDRHVAVVRLERERQDRTEPATASVRVLQ